MQRIIYAMHEPSELVHEKGSAGVGGRKVASTDRLHARAQVERLQRKFATIHSTLAQQHAQKPAEPAASPAPLRSSVPSSVNVSESFPKVGSYLSFTLASW